MKRAIFLVSIMCLMGVPRISAGEMTSAGAVIEPSAGISLNGAVFGPGDRMVVTLTTTAGNNDDLWNAYVVLFLPDNSYYFLTIDPELSSSRDPIILFPTTPVTGGTRTLLDITLPQGLPEGKWAFAAAYATPGFSRVGEISWAHFEISSKVSRVEMRNNIPTLLINDRPVASTGLYVYNAESTVNYDSAGWLDTFKGYVDKAKETGATYLGFELYFHSAMFRTPSLPQVIGDDLNFDKLDALFDYAEQRGVYLEPTLWVSNPPEWWAEQHRDELQLGYDKTAPPADAMSTGVSYNNPDYWAVMDEYIKAVVRRYRSHPALLGWSPSVGITRENNYGPSYLSSPYNPPQAWGDYSSYAKGRFRAWLADKYGNDAALRSAWDNTSVTLVTAGMPTPMTATTSSQEAVANGPGDTRPQMRDWMAFRIYEKGREWEHFIKLVKTVDPGHVLAINPAGGLFAPITAVAQNGIADGMEWTRSPYVDMVRIHPRISFDETPGPSNTPDYALFAFAAYARHAGKLSTFALEDNGESANGGKNIESLDRIRSLSEMLAAAGSGIGWSMEAGGRLPVWSNAELAETAKYVHLFDPSRRSITVPAIAILLDPKAEQTEYPLGGMMGQGSRNRDRINFYETLYKAGIEIDPVEVVEIIADPSILKRYVGIVLADMAWLSLDAAKILHEYAQYGGGLFVGGRTGLLDGSGNADFSALKTLAGLDAMPVGDTTAYATWSFDAGNDPLLDGISGKSADTGNPFYIPSADWSGNGFAQLGHAASGKQPSMLLKKGGTVIWLPRLDIQSDTLAVSLFRNWMNSLTEPAAGTVGFVGCSLSINAVNGYRKLGGSLIWPGGDSGYAGGALSAWVSQLKSGSQQGSYWAKFSNLLKQHKNPSAVWWELCPDASAASVSYDDALSVVNEIRRLAPNASIYVTGVPVYPLDGLHCSINSDEGSRATMTLAGQLVAGGSALQGPSLSSLTSSQVADGCHANKEGEEIWGKDLLDFFGK